LVGARRAPEGSPAEILATSLIVMVGFAGLMSFMTWMMYAVNTATGDRSHRIGAGADGESVAAASPTAPAAVHSATVQHLLEVVAPTTPCNLIKKLTVTVNWSGPETKTPFDCAQDNDVDTKPSMVGISFTNIGGI
jgi:hypothetical protein